ncbi:ER membrane protein complex subunit 1 [Parastagonospora nodorum]|nr:ER membrane protein complex subunit 1 [Parastagonospora nodorum]KAH4122314.1 ER membrane protein complex subunit 1 [Parastagonospora nodorum]KAH4603730.1 ER membrane protein complex subunit 1 [Parastagonospora nodorum]KAH4701352.1 ER membrane protein complex subunit 1 [Parastagonospora nodorum]KAH4703460.1 ER membrane protein complex subunit 1 [Parastagonospora nodorum]
MRFHAALTLAACLAPAAAIFEDDAYHIDFHYALLGQPQREATFFQKPYAGSKASLLYSISQNQTVAAINPRDGALVWRQHFPTAPHGHGHGHLRAGHEQDTVVSAVGDRITAWSASDGRLAWETSVRGAVVEDLEILEQEDGMTISEAKDAIVLLSGGTTGVRRLDGKTGLAKWTFEDTSGDAPYQISTSPTTIYYISLHTSMLGGSKLKVTSLSPITGKKIDQYTLSSDAEITARDHILFAGANTAAPLLAWTDKGNRVLKVNIIGTKNVATFNTPGDEVVEKIVLHAPNHINSLPHFLVEYQTAIGHSAEVYHVDLKKSTVSKAYSLPELRSKGTFTTSTQDANVYFTRITEDEVAVFSSVSHGVLGRWTLKHSLATAGAYPVHGVSEVVVKSGSASAVRSAVFYSNGQWVLHRNDELAWSRPEFLSGTVSAVWASLPEAETLAQALEEESHRNLVSAYIHRVQRHVQDLQHLPAWAQSIPARLLGSVFGKSKEATEKAIKLDTFGFHKLVVVATEQGRLAALDVGSRGKILWNVDLRKLAPEAIFSRPSLKAHRGYVEVRDAGLKGSLFVNSTTGGLASPQHVKTDASVVSDGQKLVSFTLVDGTLKGFLEDEPTSEPVWSFLPASGERIVSYTARPLKDPVASIGKVLGDRRVLYKYLNPNLVLVTAVSDATRTASVYLLDSASGQLLHTMSHSDVDTSRPIPSTISEHWFSYSLTTDAKSGASSRGYQLVVADLYESPLPDDRGPLGASSNSSTIQPSGSTGDVVKPYVLSQSYQIPAEISHMTVTQTRQGITSRELLVTVPSSNSIIGIPRQVIDPRRPIGRDPDNTEKEEGLSRYTPAIQWDPRWHLTHKYEVLGLKDVITSESGIESTSLVFAYGLDIFGTRVAPSFAFDILGKGFNKISMLITVVGLFIGVIFVAPLVRRKQINSLWTIQ